MTDYVIQTQFQGPGFVAVPNHVATNPDMTADALGVLVYLASLPSGYIIRVGDIKDRFNIKEHRWLRIAKELRNAGAMESHKIRADGGQLRGEKIFVRWPDHRNPEKPGTGKPAWSHPENPGAYKEEDKKISGRIVELMKPANGGHDYSNARRIASEELLI